MKKLVTVLATLGFVCTLFGCGILNQNTIEPDIEGADWRTTGIVDEYGTITDSEATFDVCVLKKRDRLSLYYDDISQVLYADLNFPRNLSSEELANLEIIFEDRFGDPSTDVIVLGKIDGTTVFEFPYELNNGKFEFVDMEAFDVQTAESAEYDEDFYEDQPTEDLGLEGQGSNDYNGYFTDGRIEISIQGSDGIHYDVVVTMGRAADLEQIWVMSGVYNESEGTLDYNDCRCFEELTDYDTGEATQTELYHDGCGYFLLNDDGNLLWSNPAEDYEYDGYVFEKM
ncbi:MAG: hypothetical protein K5776_02285 [Lachnospiraceae bacterium]|nr:hypothetical protein [Lachnospiraceae bacterium]